MRNLIGWLIIIASILAGLYVGIWVMFAGGIIQIINSLNPVNAVGIATGILKIIFCEMAGLITIIGCLVGFDIIY